MFYFVSCLPGIYLGKVCFLSEFFVLLHVKRYSLFIPICDTTFSSQIKYVRLDTKQAYVKYKGKKVGKVHSCTGTEALYRPYGP